VLDTLNAWHERMQIELIGAEIEVAPDTLSVVMLGALPTAL